MAEAKRLKSGRWRIYQGRDHSLVRDPDSGLIATFDSLPQARNWWSRLNPAQPSLQEAHKCARCGSYFGTSTAWVVVEGRAYHREHAPRAATELIRSTDRRR